MRKFTRQQDDAKLMWKAKVIIQRGGKRKRSTKKTVQKKDRGLSPSSLINEKKERSGGKDKAKVWKHPETTEHTNSLWKEKPSSTSDGKERNEEKTMTKSNLNHKAVKSRMKSLKNCKKKRRKGGVRIPKSQYKIKINKKGEGQRKGVGVIQKMAHLTTGGRKRNDFGSAANEKRGKRKIQWSKRPQVGGKGGVEIGTVLLNGNSVSGLWQISVGRRWRGGGKANASITLMGGPFGGHTERKSNHRKGRISLMYLSQTHADRRTKKR